MQSKDGYGKLAQHLEETLKVHLFDQNFAIESIIKTLVQMRLVHSKVRALFTFIGPPNCGKRYLAELLVTADPHIEQLKAFQMDQYNDTFNAEQLSASSIENDVTEFVAKIQMPFYSLKTSTKPTHKYNSLCTPFFQIQRRAVLISRMSSLL